MKKIVSLMLLAAMLSPTCVYAAGGSAADKEIVESILASMTLKEKIAQTLMIDIRTWNGADMTVMPDALADAMAKYKFGSFILFAENVKTTEGTFELTKALQKAAVRDGGLPLLITIDQEGGSVIRLGSGTALPGNMALCASGNVENARVAGQIIGKELLSVGINCTLAPSLDINNNANNPVIGLRSFGDDPADVSAFGNAYIQGVTEAGCIGCAKHFPGHGDTDTDSHYGLPKVDKSYDELMNFELIPFASAIESGAEMVMTAHILYPQLDDTTVLSKKTGKRENRPATMSQKIITGILKGELDFEGVVSTDAMNMAGVAANFDSVQACTEALKAGADLLCMPVVVDSTAYFYRFDNLIDGIAKAVNDGSLPMERLDDAVMRILTLKQKHGLLEYDPEAITVKNAVATLGCVEHRVEERRIAGEAVTLIRNSNGTLPYKLDGNSRVLMMCPYSNEKEDLMTGFDRAISAGLVPKGVEAKTIQYSSENYKVSGGLKKALDWATVVIIDSEISSAAKMQYGNWMAAGVRNVTDYCKEKGKPCTVVSIDKPYDVQLYPNASAVLAVYGSKAVGPNIAAGVEAALGVISPTGALPIDIPRFNGTAGKYTSEIVYKRGFGLRYAEPVSHQSVSRGIGSGPAIAYTVKKGDNLCKIALEHYGTMAAWKTIYEANLDKIRNPKIITPGQTILLP